MTVSREAYLAALRDLEAQKQLASHNVARSVAGVPVRQSSKEELATALLEKATWTPLGTNSVGGRTRSIVIDPHDSKIMWIGSVGGGIWRSDDGGQTFTKADDFMPSLAVSCMTIDSEGTVYAGTGESFDAGDGIKGAGLFRSENGRNWEQVNSTKNNRNFEYVNRLAASPQPRSTTLLVATASGVFRSTDSTDRNDWTPTSLKSAAADVKFSPDGTRAIAGGFKSNGTVNSYFSTDDGLTWKTSKHSDTWQGRVELTFAMANPKIVYASVDNNSGEIWESKDGGESFEKKGGKTSDGSLAYYLGDPSGDPRYDQGTYANAIWAGDADLKVLIVGGLDLWISKDEGDTLKPISSWWDTTSAHADQHAIVSVPGYEKKGGSVFFANDGGIFEAPDISKVGAEAQPPYSKGWTNHSATYQVTQFYSGAISPKTGTIIGGSQDNGTIRLDHGTHLWSQALKNGGGDGGQSGVDMSGVFYGEYVNLNIHRSTDDGHSFLYISGQYWNPCKKNPDNSLGGYEWKKEPFAIADAENSDDALFIAPFVVDPKNDNRIYAGARSLWLTNNAKAKNVPADIADKCTRVTTTDGKMLTGPSWKRIKAPVGKEAKDTISAIAVSPESVWVAYANGNIYKSIGGTIETPTWSEPLNKNTPKWPHRYCTSIKIDPQHSETVYVTFSDYQPDNVWKTENGGQDWKSIGATLPRAPIRSVAVHPMRSAFVYLGTEVGLFASEDSGTTWSPTNEGPTNASVEQIFWMGTTLYAATHGRGMWQITLPK